MEFSRSAKKGIKRREEDKDVWVREKALEGGLYRTEGKI